MTISGRRTELTVRKENTFGRYLTLVPSSVMLGVFFLIPFVLILAVSVAHKTPGGDFIFGFTAAHYERFFSGLYIGRTIFSTVTALSVSVLTLLVAFPFTYMLTRFTGRYRTLWLIYILAQLSLSEVLIAFGWQVLFSSTAGLSNFLVLLGIVDESFPMAPSLSAVITALVYLALPFAVLLLYPALSRIDKSYMEASQTMGASPVRTFFTVVVPIARPALISTGVTMFVLTLGAIITPQVLGRPSHWTLSVLIQDQAIFSGNMPFAAALAVVLLILAGGVIALVLRLNKGNG